MAVLLGAPSPPSPQTCAQPVHRGPRCCPEVQLPPTALSPASHALLQCYIPNPDTFIHRPLYRGLQLRPPPGASTETSSWGREYLEALFSTLSAQLALLSPSDQPTSLLNGLLCRAPLKVR